MGGSSSTCCVRAQKKKRHYIYHLRERLVVVAEPRQVHERVRPEALHGHERQVAAEVPRVGPRDGQAVAEARERRAGEVAPAAPLIPRR